MSLQRRQVISSNTEDSEVGERTWQHSRVMIMKMNEKERADFRVKLLSMLKGYQQKEVRTELRRILEGVKSNDPYNMLKEKNRIKFKKKKTEF